MKKIILGVFILIGIFTSTSVFAEDGYERVKTCVVTSVFEYYMSGKQCQGPKEELYYIKDKEVTKTVFDVERKNYYLKGPICDGAEKTKQGDFPEGYSATCAKGKYGEYSLAGKKVSYGDFFASLMSDVFNGALKNANAETLVQLNKEKKVLKSLKTFTAALNDVDTFYSFNFEKVGSSCTGNGSLTWNGNGYKNLVCENDKVISLDYYLKDKKVTYNTYVKSIYKTAKVNNKSAIASLKK